MEPYEEEPPPFLGNDDIAFLEALLVVAAAEKAKQEAQKNYTHGCLTGILVTAALASLCMTPKPLIKSLIKTLSNPFRMEQRVQSIRDYQRSLRRVSSQHPLIQSESKVRE